MTNKYSMNAQGEWLHSVGVKLPTKSDKILMSISVIGGFIMLLNEMVKAAF